MEEIVQINRNIQVHLSRRCWLGWEKRPRSRDEYLCVILGDRRVDVKSLYGIRLVAIGLSYGGYISRQLWSIYLNLMHYEKCCDALKKHRITGKCFEYYTQQHYEMKQSQLTIWAPLRKKLQLLPFISNRYWPFPPSGFYRIYFIWLWSRKPINVSFLLKSGHCTSGKYCIPWTRH